MVYSHPLGDREVIAYFHNQKEAERAARKVHSDVTASNIFAVSTQEVHHITHDAKAGVSVVEIGAFAWWGLLIGSIIGGFWGAVVFSGQVAIPGIIAPTLSAGLVSVIFLWAGILACIGWLLGALVPIFSRASGDGQYQVRVTVPQETLTPVEQVLAKAGATDVITMNSG